MGDFGGLSTTVSDDDDLVYSVKWHALAGLIFALSSFLVFAISRTITFVVVGYLFGLLGTVVAMYAAVHQRKVASDLRYVDSGFNVLAVARVVRIAASTGCFLNTILLAGLISR